MEIRKQSVPRNRSASKKTVPQKLKLLVTVVNRNKAEFYLDLIQTYEVNLQTVTFGKGTANSEMLQYLGLADSEKAIIFSIIKEDNANKIMAVLKEKFSSIRNGKGIAYTVSLSSIIGVAIYQFLSNNQGYQKKEENK